MVWCAAAHYRGLVCNLLLLQPEQRPYMISHATVKVGLLRSFSFPPLRRHVTVGSLVETVSSGDGVWWGRCLVETVLSRARRHVRPAGPSFRGRGFRARRAILDIRRGQREESLQPS